MIFVEEDIIFLWFHSQLDLRLLPCNKHIIGNCNFFVQRKMKDLLLLFKNRGNLPLRATPIQFFNLEIDIFFVLGMVMLYNLRTPCEMHLTSKTIFIVIYPAVYE